MDESLLTLLKAIARNMKQRRKELGINQRKLAEIVGNTYRKLETRERLFSVPVVYGLVSDAFSRFCRLFSLHAAL